jgi:predicted nucleic acid-binding protein
MHIEWLKAARDDLILLTDILNNENITHLIAFHSQQAVEKSIKAYLEYQNLEVPKIDQTIKNRQQCKIKTSDAIIGATAMIHGFEIVTNNIDDFKKLDLRKTTIKLKGA